MYHRYIDGIMIFLLYLRLMKTRYTWFYQMLIKRLSQKYQGKFRLYLRIIFGWSTYYTGIMHGLSCCANAVKNCEFLLKEFWKSTDSGDRFWSPLTSRWNNILAGSPKSESGSPFGIEFFFNFYWKSLSKSENRIELIGNDIAEVGVNDLGNILYLGNI